MTPAPSAAPAPVNPQHQAIDKIRDTARWLILAFAAIGAVLAGSAPLSNLGKLDLDDWRLWLAAGSAVLAFVAIAAAIWFAADVFSPVTRDLPTLVQDADVKALFNANPEVLGDYTSLDEFKAAYEDAKRRRTEAGQKLRTNPNDQAAAADREAARKTLTTMAPAVRRIVDEGLLLAVRKKFKEARPYLYGGAFVAALAIVAFAWAANPPTMKEGKAKPKRKHTLSLGPLSVSTRGAGVTIMRRDAIAFLTRRGFTHDLARSYVESFTGPIELRTVPRGMMFRRFTSARSGSGSFLTTATFANPTAARLALHLPWKNKAACIQTVTARRRALVLGGEIEQGKPHVPQVFVLNRKAFTFASGKNYGGNLCPKKKDPPSHN
jgi:hypothetical protein